MNAVVILLVGLVILIAAYLTYGTVSYTHLFRILGVMIASFACC